MRTDVVIITAPYTMSSQPLAAPAVLFAVLKQHYSTKFIDLNAEFNINPDKVLSDYFLYGTIVPGWAEKFTQYINDCVERVAQAQPTWVGVSLFSMYSQRFTEFFCKTLRLRYPQIKIILGGQGLSVNGINSETSLGHDLQEDGIVDAWVKSEGESVLLDILAQGGNVGSNNWNQILNIDELDFPCYDNYDFNLYSIKSLPITGSRGCVRKCTFCDIHMHWKKFVYRSGENIVKEIIYQSNKTGITDFIFTDSLVNGSMKAYRDMIDMLASHNETIDNKITWTSQFIIRPKNQMTEEDWKNTKLSGSRRLSVGVESLIEHIRDDMGKKFSNDDIIFSLEQAQKFGITLSFLMLVGYVTETEEDHQEQLKLFETLVPFKDVLEVNLGSTLGILPGTPLYNEPAKWSIELGKNENTWIVPSINNTYEVRQRRRMELEEHLKKIGLVKDNALIDMQHNLMDIWK